jgi:hypothetical protein
VSGPGSREQILGTISVVIKTEANDTYIRGQVNRIFTEVCGGPFPSSAGSDQCLSK